MRRLLNQPWFATALAILAIALVGRELIPTASSRFASADPAVSPVDPAAAEPAGEPAPASPAALLGELPAEASPRDPFAPRPGARAAKAGHAKIPDHVDTLHLSALWTEHASTLALINGQIRQLGDTIGRLRIAAASQDGVWVTHGTARDFIPLGGDFTLRTPAASEPLPVTFN